MVVVTVISCCDRCCSDKVVSGTQHFGLFSLLLFILSCTSYLFTDVKGKPVCLLCGDSWAVIGCVQ